MCKSENEPGGPYRCSGDMRSRLDTATTRLAEARAETNAAAAEDIEAKERLRSLTQRLDDPSLTEDARATYATAAASAAKRSEQTGQRATSAASKFASASASWRDARRDYDATPRGLAELQAAEHAARASEQASLNERAGDALRRIQQDEDMRASKWGTSRDSYFIPRTGLDAANTDPAIASHIQDAKGNLTLRASAKAHADGTYTYTFFSPSNTRGTAIQVTPNRDGSAPTTSGLLSQMRSGAQTHRASANFAQHCKSNGIDRRDEAAAEQARSEYADAKRHDRDGERIFGKDTWDAIVAHHL